MTIATATAADLRFDLLGPLRVTRITGGFEEEIDLGPAKQRAVLAVLLLAANRPVTPAAILDAVWRDDPPANGPNVVQKHIAGLRRALEPERSPRAPGGVLALTDAGYVLTVAPGSLDTQRFDGLVARARAAADAGDPTTASRRLDEAIGMLRAAPLAGLTGPVFDAARERLRDAQGGAYEAWADAELALGHHERIVTTLADLVARFPVRERLRGQHLLALYRCGRQAEALAAYRDAQRHLDEEFGVQPGEELAALHRRILRGDRDLLTPEPPVAVAVPPGRFDPATLVSGPPPRRPRRTGRVVLVAVMMASSLLTMGAATGPMMSYVAAYRHSWRMAGWAVAYTAAFWAAFATTGEINGDLGVLGMIAVGAAGCVHLGVALIPRLVAVPVAPPPTPAFEQHVRRDIARRIVVGEPAVAAALRIGRPHEPRTFNDGGLVDVNAVPEHVLVIALGLAPAVARRLVDERAGRGPFRTVDELAARGVLARAELDYVRELLVAGAP